MNVPVIASLFLTSDYIMMLKDNSDNNKDQKRRKSARLKNNEIDFCSLSNNDNDFEDGLKDSLHLTRERLKKGDHCQPIEIGIDSRALKIETEMIQEWTTPCNKIENITTSDCRRGYQISTTNEQENKSNRAKAA